MNRMISATACFGSVLSFWRINVARLWYFSTNFSAGTWMGNPLKVRTWV